MENNHKNAINKFFLSLDELRNLGIVRFSVIFGDIGEFLCTKVFSGLSLEGRRTNHGYDATYEGQKVQIKFSNSSDAKNIDLGNPEKYDVLIVVLGKKSTHIMLDDSNSDYLFYKYTSNEVKNKFKTNGKFKLSKTKHFKKAEKHLSLHQN
ncbi:MAG: hypothetical protein AB3X44_10135 [Leptothrix sp. (in: b-proteobacteria)]